MRKTGVFTLVFFLFFVAALPGQERNGFEIGPYAGMEYWSERTFEVGLPQASPPISLGFRYKDKPVYGVRANLMSRGYWGGELDYSYQKNTATLTRSSFAPVELTGGVHHIFYNMILYPTRYGARVTPFLTGGVGLAAYRLNDDTIAKAADPRDYGIGTLESLDKRFAFNYGAGVKVNVSSGFGVRFDFRHTFSDVPSYGLPKQSSNPAQVVLPIEGKLQTYEASAGIYFRILK